LLRQFATQRSAVRRRKEDGRDGTNERPQDSAAYKCHRILGWVAGRRGLTELKLEPRNI